MEIYLHVSTLGGDMNIWLQMVHGGSADLLWIPADLYSETENLLINSDVSVMDRIN